jgi:hypothetical protein
VDCMTVRRAMIVFRVLGQKCNVKGKVIYVIAYKLAIFKAGSRIPP